MSAVFDEDARLRAWLDVIAALAEAQAELEIIPHRAAAAIRDHADPSLLDLAFVAEQTRSSGHSMLGLIHGLRRLLPDHASEWVYYGATVQDVTDTWTGLVMRRVGGVLWRQLHAIEGSLLRLADDHRNTPMLGRTHGQPGSPITFGYKAASWADEVRRHIERLRSGGPRWAVGQLGGAVGTLAFFGSKGIELRRRFCARLGLEDPGISWLAARDRLADFSHLAAMVTATLGRVGGDVYALQRPEIAELIEPVGPGVVGSITMPHKRNPETAEHLVTLSRLARAHAAVLLESMVTEHERDGRAWKAEWVSFAEVCLLAGASLSQAAVLLTDLEVDVQRMCDNIEGSHGYAASERVLAELAPVVGKHQAQTLLQAALADARRAGLSLSAALAGSRVLTDALPPDAVERVTAAPDTGAAGAMVDAVVQRAQAARSEEPASWPC